MRLTSVLLSSVQERAADDSKEVEGFQQLLLARTQVNLDIISVIAAFVLTPKEMRRFFSFTVRLQLSS